MNRVRIERRRPGFVQIDNAVTRDNRISIRARGALGYLLSQADEFTLNVAEWAKENRDGEPAWKGKQAERVVDLRESRDAIGAAMKELEAAGYLSRFRVQDEDGHWGWDFVLREYPITEDGSPVFGPTRENAEFVQVEPKTAQPNSGEPSSKEELMEGNTQKTRFENQNPGCGKCENQWVEQPDGSVTECECRWGKPELRVVK